MNDSPIAVRKIIRLSTMDGFFYSLMLGCGETYLVAFALALGFKSLTAGLLAILPLVAASFLQPLVAIRLRRHFTPRSWVAMGALVQASALCLMAFGGYKYHSDINLLVNWFYVVTTVYWISALAIGPVWNAWIGRLIPPEQHLTFFVNRNRWIQLATLIGLVTAGIYLQNMSDESTRVSTFTLMFLISAAFRLLSAFSLLFHPNLPADAQEEPLHVSRPQSFWEWFKTYPVALMLLFSFLTNMAVFFSSPIFTPYVLRHLKVSYSYYTVLIGTAFIARIVTSRFLIKFGNRYGVRAMLLCGVAGIIPAAWAWTLSTNMWYLLLVQFFTGFVWNCHELGFTLYLMETMPYKERAQLLSWSQLCTALGMLIGSLAGSYYVGSEPFSTAAYYKVFTMSTLLRMIPLTVFLFWTPIPLKGRVLYTRILGLRSNGHSIMKPILQKSHTERVAKHLDELR